MKCTKALPLLLVLILVTNLSLIANLANAASMPSVPEFTVQYIDHAFDVAPTYRTDPYTGQTVQTSPGYRESNKTIDVTIKNQPFTPYVNAQNQTIALYYDVRVKGHYEDWGSGYGTHSARAVKASSSSHTVVNFVIQYWGVQNGGEIDFQVKAVTGYSYYNSAGCYNDYQVDTVADSGWSNTFTLKLGEAAYSPPPPTNPPSTPFNPTAPPTYPTENPTSDPLNPILPDTDTGFLSRLDWKQTALIVMAVVITVLVVALIFAIWRRSPTRY